MKRNHIHPKSLWLSLITLLISGIFTCSVMAQQLEEPAEKPAAETVQNEEPQLDTNEETDTAADEEGEEINGSADNLERFEKDGITILTGNVKILRTDGYLNADKVTFYTDPVTGDTIRTVAESNVEIRDAELFATCEHATMNHLTNTIILKTDVVVLQNKDRLETVLFTYNRTTGEQTAQGDVKFKVRVIEAEPVTAEEAPETDAETGETAEGTDEQGTETAGNEIPAETPAETPTSAAEGTEQAAPDAESEAPAAAETEGNAEADSQQPEAETTDESAAENSQQPEAEEEVETETEEEK